MIHDDIRTMLDAPPTGEAAPSLDDVEHTLTAGYAEALALEAERWRLERRLAGAAARLGDEATGEPQVAELGQRLAATDGTLTQSVKGFQRWLSNRTGGRTLRMDTARGELDITFVRLSKTDA